MRPPEITHVPTAELARDLLAHANASFSAEDVDRVRTGLTWMLELHLPQADRPDGPYVFHTIRVATNVHRWSSGTAPADVLIAGMLHDSLEDQPQALAQRGPGTAQQALEATFGTEVLRLVESLTNPTLPPGLSRAEKNEHYVGHVIELLERDDWSSVIKAADLWTNALSLHGVDDLAVRQRLTTKYRPVVQALERWLNGQAEDSALHLAVAGLRAQLHASWQRDYAQ
jgi:(p)ppGpp synthase/HD superfamily hydrolase